MTHHIFTAEPVVMSLDKFNSFTPEEQQMLLSCAYEAAKIQREKSYELESGQMDSIKDYEGVEVNVVEDLTPFREACVPVYDQFRSTLGEYIDMIEDAK